MRRLLFRLLRSLARPLWGRGFGGRLPVVQRVYSSAFRRLMPAGTMMSEVHGLKIYANGRTSIAETLAVTGSYEEETTRLFHESLREGMTVLDIGANIGYYTLLAAKQVGDTGRVFAFEPWPESLSLLRRSMKANGLSNIVPLAKAVSDRCGKQRLFLGNDPALHSLEEEGAGREWIETEVITVDEFLRGQNRSIDLVKIDVEGSEGKVLEGMADTIRANPGLKLIIEFVPDRLERHGCSPSAFLKKLSSLGFKLCLIREGNHTCQLVAPDSIEDIVKSLEGSCGTAATNIYCY